MGFEQIYNKYQKSILNYLHTISSLDNSTLKDIAQETWLDFWKCRHKLNPNKSPLGFIKTIAHHRAIDYYRKQVEDIRRNIHRIEYRNPLSFKGKYLTIDKKLDQTNERLDLQYAFTHLSDDIRKKIYLLYVEHYTIKEIACRFNLHPSKIQRQIEHGKKLIKEILK